MFSIILSLSLKVVDEVEVVEEVVEEVVVEVVVVEEEVEGVRVFNLLLYCCVCEFECDCNCDCEFECKFDCVFDCVYDPVCVGYLDIILNTSLYISRLGDIPASTIRLKPSWKRVKK